MFSFGLVIHYVILCISSLLQAVHQDEDMQEKPSEAENVEEADVTRSDGAASDAGDAALASAGEVDGEAHCFMNVFCVCPSGSSSVLFAHLANVNCRFSLFFMSRFLCVSLHQACEDAILETPVRDGNRSGRESNHVSSCCDSVSSASIMLYCSFFTSGCASRNPSGPLARTVVLSFFRLYSLNLFLQPLWTVSPY